MSTAAAQFGRDWSLLLANGESILDLSNLHFRFEVFASDIETPNVAVIRVYNPSQQTINEAIKEYSSVILQAGYKNIGARQIFKGTVKQYTTGRERNVDTFLDIKAADGDVGYNFGFINQSVPAGTLPEQLLQIIANGMGVTIDPNAQEIVAGGIRPSPRGKVFFGLARSFMRDLARTADARWSIQNGVLTVIPLAGFLPGVAIEINSATGMIGVPEATDQGISVEMLLNPQIKIGQPVKLNNADITNTIIKEQFFPGRTDFNYVATLDTRTDGMYRVVVVEHAGDTRGQEWTTKLTCLNLDSSAAGSGNAQVQAYPGSM